MTTITPETTPDDFLASAVVERHLSPKTIEAHLGRVYRKLGIRSRTELARQFAPIATVTPLGEGERLAAS